MARRTREAVDLAGSDETEAMERDRVKQERGPAVVVVPRIARRQIHAVSPVHGEPVTFNPGELLPSWVKVADGDLR
jgi:hypothetical protein